MSFKVLNYADDDEHILPNWISNLLTQPILIYIDWGILSFTWTEALCYRHWLKYVYYMYTNAVMITDLPVIRSDQPTHAIAWFGVSISSLDVWAFDVLVYFRYAVVSALLLRICVLFVGTIVLWYWHGVFYPFRVSIFVRTILWGAFDKAMINQNDIMSLNNVSRCFVDSFLVEPHWQTHAPFHSRWWYAFRIFHDQKTPQHRWGQTNCKGAETLNHKMCVWRICISAAIAGLFVVGFMSVLLFY